MHALHSVVGLTQSFQKTLGVGFTNRAKVLPLITTGGKQLQCRRAKQLVAIKQRALLGIATRHIEAHQPVISQLFAHRGHFEYFSFDYFATDAPVGVPVQQQRLAGSFR